MRMLLLSAVAILAAGCGAPVQEPAMDTEPKVNPPIESVTNAAPLPATNEESNVPAECKAANAPTIPNGAPCSVNFYADYYPKVCAAWREKCCDYKGVCS